MFSRIDTAKLITRFSNVVVTIPVSDTFILSAQPLQQTLTIVRVDNAVTTR